MRFTGTAICTVMIFGCLVLLSTILYKLFNPRKSSENKELQSDDPLIDMLHHTLAGRTGELRISDAYLICGIEPGKVNQDQISRFGKAIRELGWERSRPRLDRPPQYTYVKGTASEQKVKLIVEYDPHLRRVCILGGPIDCR